MNWLFRLFLGFFFPFCFTRSIDVGGFGCCDEMAAMPDGVRAYEVTLLAALWDCVEEVK